MLCAEMHVWKQTQVGCYLSTVFTGFGVGMRKFRSLKLMENQVALGSCMLDCCCCCVPGGAGVHLHAKIGIWQADSQKLTEAL